MASEDARAFYLIDEFVSAMEGLEAQELGYTPKSPASPFIHRKTVYRWNEFRVKLKVRHVQRFTGTMGSFANQDETMIAKKQHFPDFQDLGIYP